MKKNTFLLILMTFSFGFSQTAPIDFEIGGHGGTWGWSTFENVSNVPLEIVNNPDSSGANTSATVARLTPLQAGMPWAGCQSAHGSDIGTFNLTSTNCIVKIMVWKSVKSDVGIKFATAGNASTGEIKVANTLINQWQELTFDFSSKIGEASSTGIDQIVIFPDFQSRTSDNICFFDNITFSAPVIIPPIAGITLPIDFESSELTYTFTDFDGGIGTKVSNPQSIGMNTSATVGKIIKGSGAIWAGSKLTMAAPINFSTNKVIKIKVISPVAGRKLLLKLEGGAAFELLSSPITNANMWEELTFDFTSVAVNNTNNQMTFMFDFGTVGDGSSNSTYYFDDVAQMASTAPTLTQMSLPVTFEDPTIDYGTVSFGDAVSSIEVDPTLATNHVVKVIKQATAQTWAGTTLTAATNLGFNPAVPFSASNKKMNIKIWSPDAGITIRLKVEDHNNVNHYVEKDVQTSSVGWQILEFDFSNPTTAAFDSSFVYDKASIFFNFGIDGATAGSKTYYFDDVLFGAAPLSNTTFTVKDDLKIYPNPSRGIFRVESTGRIDSVVIYNLLGQEILSQSPKSNTLAIDLSDVEKGMYIVKTSIYGNVITSRIIKE